MKNLTVLRTNDYEKFNHLSGNRIINELNLAKIKKSMEENFLISPILVNEHLEIIDGQHRLQAVKELGFPVYYFVNKGYGLKEVQALNSNGKN